MLHPDRREFLAVLAAASVDVVRWPSAWTRAEPRAPASPPAPPAVVAETTPFYAHPDGQRCLVRFFVSDLDAPAGRMRAFDGAQRLLGTAGVIPLGDGRLYGELWLPLGALSHIRTELEAPGLRRPVATRHALTPAPRWTIHWVTLLDPEGLRQRLAFLDPISRAVEISTLQQIGAMIAPAPSSVPRAIGDVPFMRLAEPANRIAAEIGTARGSAAVVTTADLRVPSLAAVLVGSGITLAVVRDPPAAGLYWLHAPDGSRLLVAAVPVDADPGSLAFMEGGDRMVRAVERLLAEGIEGTAGTVAATAAERIALVVGTGMENLPRAAENARDWNARFAYPRIVVGDAPAFLRAAPATSGNRIPPWAAPPSAERHVPSLVEVMDLTERRATESRRRADAMIACLAPLVPGPGTGLERIANQLAMPVPGTLVFNPTSYARTELVRLANGAERLVTDIPPLGYAYFPTVAADERGWRTMEGDRPPVIQTARFRLALDPDTGAIRSLVTLEDDTEWVNQTMGLDAVDDARLEATVREALPGVAVRVVAQRRAPWGEVRTVVTAYEGLPWIDVVNHAEPGDAAVAYRFGFALQATGVEWETPAGVARATPPCDCTHLRWLRLKGERGSALLAARQAALGWVDPDSTLTSYSPPGESRFRIGLSSAGEFVFREDPWRFGWGIEPFVAAPVPETGGATLPSFGALLMVDQPGIAVAGLQPAADGDGVIVYLQELSGRARVATLGAGLIGFEDARQVDLIERDLGAPAMVMRNGVGVMLPALGVAAVRLQGVTLARG